MAGPRQPEESKTWRNRLPEGVLALAGGLAINALSVDVGYGGALVVAGFAAVLLAANRVRRLPEGAPLVRITSLGSLAAALVAIILAVLLPERWQEYAVIGAVIIATAAVLIPSMRPRVSSPSSASPSSASDLGVGFVGLGVAILRESTLMSRIRALSRDPNADDSVLSAADHPNAWHVENTSVCATTASQSTARRPPSGGRSGRQSTRVRGCRRTLVRQPRTGARLQPSLLELPPDLLAVGLSALDGRLPAKLLVRDVVGQLLVFNGQPGLSHFGDSRTDVLWLVRHSRWRPVRCPT